MHVKLRESVTLFHVKGRKKIEQRRKSINPSWHGIPANCTNLLVLCKISIGCKCTHVGSHSTTIQNQSPKSKEVNALECLWERESIAYLYPRATLLLQQNVFRFHVAVNNFELVEGIQTLQQRMSKFTNKLQAEALKLIFLDQLIQIYMQKLKNDAHVIPKNKVIEPESEAENSRQRKLY